MSEFLVSSHTLEILEPKCLYHQGDESSEACRHIPDGKAREPNFHRVLSHAFSKPPNRLVL